MKDDVMYGEVIGHEGEIKIVENICEEGKEKEEQINS